MRLRRFSIARQKKNACSKLKANANVNNKYKPFSNN